MKKRLAAGFVLLALVIGAVYYLLIVRWEYQLSFDPIKIYRPVERLDFLDPAGHEPVQTYLFIEVFCASETKEISCDAIKRQSNATRALFAERQNTCGAECGDSICQGYVCGREPGAIARLMRPETLWRWTAKDLAESSIGKRAFVDLCTSSYGPVKSDASLQLVVSGLDPAFLVPDPLTQKIDANTTWYDTELDRYVVTLPAKMTYGGNEYEPCTAFDDQKLRLMLRTDYNAG